MSKSDSFGICKKCGNAIEWKSTGITTYYPGSGCMSSSMERIVKMYEETKADSKYCEDCLSKMPLDMLSKVLSVPKDLCHEFLNRLGILREVD